jgi:hypothetical protein
MKSKTIHQKNIFWVFVVIWFSRINTTFFILAFDVDLPYLTMIATSVYFLASSLPTFQFWTLPLKEVLLFISSGFWRQRWIVILFLL